MTLRSVLRTLLGRGYRKEFYHMATVPYSRVKEYLRSLTGIDDFTTVEDGFLKSAFNRRVRMAYEESRHWPRYIQEEMRNASFDNVIPQQATGYREIDTVLDIQSENPRVPRSNADRYEWIMRADGAKVVDVEDADYEEVVYTATKDTIASGAIVDLKQYGNRAYAISFWLRTPTIPTDYGNGYDGMSTLVINAEATGTTTGNSGGGIGFYPTSDTTFVGANSWLEPEGTAMTVYGDGLNIGTDFGNGDAGVQVQNAFDGNWHHFVWTFVPGSTKFNIVGTFHYELSSSETQRHNVELEFADVRIYPTTIDANQAWTLYTNPELVLYNPIWTSSAPQYWVSYKAALTATIGDGQGEEQNVPLEFFEYGIHGAYADWLRGEGQTDKAIAEEQFAAQHLQRQLEKITYGSGSPGLWSRFMTHSTRQRR